MYIHLSSHSNPNLNLLPFNLRVDAFEPEVKKQKVKVRMAAELNA